MYDKHYQSMILINFEHDNLFLFTQLELRFLFPLVFKRFDSLKKLVGLVVRFDWLLFKHCRHYISILLQ